MDRLTELQSKRDADERFLTHRETHELLRLQEAAIERLTLEVNKLATECGHWEADWMERDRETERLRAALTAIAKDNPNQVRTPTMLATIARQALAGGSDEG